jgi:hypothetical protein
MEINNYAPASWSPRAQRLYNLGTYAHFKACDIEREQPRDIDGKFVMFPTPRAAWYSAWSMKLYRALDKVPDEETPNPDMEGV